MTRRSGKKPNAAMKPVVAWCVVYRSDNMMRGAETFALNLHKSRQQARDEKDALTDLFGPICRIARVEIREVKKP